MWSHVVPCEVCVELRLAVGGAVDPPCKLFVLPAACLAGTGTPQREETDGLGWGEGKGKRGQSHYDQGAGNMWAHLRREGGGVGRVVHSGPGTCCSLRSSEQLLGPSCMCAHTQEHTHRNTSREAWHGNPR